ncbi:hypothetical protein [Nonomuraea fuscirosea]|uniref:hypothetical protein n=1 Tax=Nonomuraea fuscirosea TaxID=1291556 RepID=UPI0033C8FC18
MAGFAMRMILGGSNTDVLFVEKERSWTFHWGGAGHVDTFLAPPGADETDEDWYLSFQPSARSAAVPQLLVIVVSAVAALLTGGTLDDDEYSFDRTDLDPEALLSQVLRAAPLEPEAAVHLLRTGRPQSTAS